jgi:spore germination cell wall hydrolase CwlJ-like protein
VNEHYSPTGARHLHLEGVEVVDLPRPSRRKRLTIILAALVAIAAIVAAVILLPRPMSSVPAVPKPAATAQPQSPAAQALADLPPPDLLRSLTTEQAVAANAERPIVARTDDPAATFRLSGDAISKLRAIDCLTQAIYYEAASEGVDGGRAVAQVVLNRVRHAGYPNSVCGVVFEGSMRTTGCQFSFTCDGSLARVPVAYLWARSRLIANQALAGRIFAPVGHATHYHADYVLPYWADSLDKVAVIGRHIFYRLRGGNGSRAAFGQRYAGAESMPSLPPSTDVIEQGMNAVEAEPIPTTLPALPRVEEDRVAALEPAPAAVPQAKEPLAADLTRGQLILGEATPTSKPKRQAAPGCEVAGASRIKPTGAADLKVGSPTPAC